MNLLNVFPETITGQMHGKSSSIEYINSTLLEHSMAQMMATMFWAGTYDIPLDTNRRMLSADGETTLQK